MIRSRRLVAALAASVLTLSSVALADEGLATEGKTIDGFNFRLPVYNADKVGSTVVGLDKYVGPDASDKNTKILLLSFMASFCGPCKKEMPYLESLHEKYKDKGLRIVMVSIDTEVEGQKKIDELIAMNKVTFPVLKDRFNLAARRWLGSKTPLPSVFLIKPDGTIQTVHRGYNAEASELFASAIEQAIGVKAEAKTVTATQTAP
ncbi:MAG: TlpA disulfide reductase family protein [Myxococcaceae bacterium]